MTFEQAELLRRHAREEPSVLAQPSRASNLPRPQDSAEYHAPEGLYTAITKDSIWGKGSQEWGDFDFTVPQSRHQRVGGLASLLEKQGPFEVVQAMHDCSKRVWDDIFHHFYCASLSSDPNYKHDPKYGQACMQSVPGNKPVSIVQMLIFCV